MQTAWTAERRVSPAPVEPPETVGAAGPNRYVTPVGQVLTPAGHQVELPGLRPQALALSPNGKLLVTAGKASVLVVMDAATGKIRQRVPLATNQAEVKVEASPTESEDPALNPEVAETGTSGSTNANTSNGGSTNSGATTSGTTNSGTGTSGSRSNAPAPSNPVLSFTGLAFAPDGQHIYLSTASGSLRAFPVDRKNVVGRPVSIQVPGPPPGPGGFGRGRGFGFGPGPGPDGSAGTNRSARPGPGPGPGAGSTNATGVAPTNAPGFGRGPGRGLGGFSRQRRDIPTGLAVSADSQRIYVAGNVGNKLHEIEAATGKALRSWDTGVAPYDVALAAGKAYVSNLGGRRSKTNDLTAPAGRGSPVRVDPVRFIANEGSVTVIDLEAGQVKTEIIVGLHASALAVSPDRKYVVVANTGSDTLSVIDTRTDEVVEKIWARQSPADLFGAQPNALAFDRRGRRLYVCNGTQNSVAVVEFAPAERASQVIGLIPVGWFPGAIVVDGKRDTLCVANIKGLGALKRFKPGSKVKLNSKDYFGTVSFVPVPYPRARAALTEQALRNMRHPKVAEALQPARPAQPARPVPERVGEPSVFQHVIYVIKENRTYDQVLGDMPEGNGDANLCTFGQKYTPNQHKIAREFVLLDNTYCAGVQSADGHQWTDSALANEYVERQLTAGFPRSYPGAKAADGADALAWASSGFIWDNALAHGKTFRNYGEWMISTAGWKERGRRDRISWRDFWNDFNCSSNLTRLSSRAALEGLRKYSPTNTVGWDLHVPDVMRAAAFLQELRQFETQGGFPNFIILFLPNDHTGGTRDRYPTPGAQVADNDLAFGRVVEGISRSKFWPKTCLFAIEDDPQMGWDHVSGYRTTCFVASPYTKRKQTVSTQYNQLSLMRTMELILGLPPMNQMDASATPMNDCFTDLPDFTPFTSVTNQVPLDRINPDPKKVADPVLRQDAIVSARLPLDEMDRCPEDVFNRILWRAMKGTGTPYPEWAVKTVSDDD
jgi:YVTN family beta-propeller protein